MPSEFPMNDPRSIWRNQPTEPLKMSADELRRKAQRRQRKARFAALFSIIVGLILFVFFARAFVKIHELIPRIGFGLISFWCIYFAYQAYRWVWPGRLAPDAALNTTLQSYRSELEKQRDYGRHIWRRAGLTFCFLGVAMLIVPEMVKSLHNPRLLVNVAPVSVLLAIWFATFFFIRKRQQQKLQREIEELHAFERENQ